MASLPRAPMITTPLDTKDQIRELKNYLFRLVDEIEVAFEEIDRKIVELDRERKESI